jgi:hypothetical protein
MSTVRESGWMKLDVFNQTTSAVKLIIKLSNELNNGKVNKSNLESLLKNALKKLENLNKI